MRVRSRLIFQKRKTVADSHSLTRLTAFKGPRFHGLEPASILLSKTRATKFLTEGRCEMQNEEMSSLETGQYQSRETVDLNVVTQVAQSQLKETADLNLGPSAAEIFKMKNSELTQSLERLTKAERKITHLALLHIQQVELRKIYLDLGYSSMFEYLTRRLGYSESCAYRRLQSARLLKSVPEIGYSLESGSLKLTQLSQVQSALRAKQKEISKRVGERGFSLKAEAQSVLQKLQNKTQKETEVILAREFDLPLQKDETEKHQKDSSVRIELTLSSAEFAQLRALKNQMSHQNSEMSWKGFILQLATKEIKKRSCAEKVQAADEFQKSKALGSLKSQQNRSVSARIKRELFSEARSRCEYIHLASGQRCSSEAFLQIDHIVPKFFGGSNDKNNLRVLCQAHNLAEARAWGIHWQS